MKRISIGSWAYVIGPYEDNPVPWEEVVKNLSDLGFDGVELGAFPPHPNPKDLPEKEQRDAVKEQMEEAGLEFSGVAADFWGENLINTDDTTPYIESFRRYIQFALDLGIDRIRVDTVQPPDILKAVDKDAARKQVVDTWKTCTEEAADAGLTVSWEFEPGFAFNKPSDIEQIVDEVGHPSFGVMVDTCHAHMVAAEGAKQPEPVETLPGGGVELVRRLKGKINHIHLIDSDGTLHDDETSTHAPFGQGLIKWDEMMPALNEAGVPHDWWTIDLCFWPDAWKVTEQCKTYVDDLNARYG